MFFTKEISINTEGLILEIQYEDNEFLKEKLFVDFLKVNTQYGEYFMFAVKNKDYEDRLQLFIKAIGELYKKMDKYLREEAGYDGTSILVDHKSALVIC
jgi:hypothetical protein